MIRYCRLDIIRNRVTRRWHWSFFATNGLQLARSSETYRRREDCERSAALTLGVTGVADSTRVPRMNTRVTDVEVRVWG